MSENNKNVDFNDEKEPIDSIEQTVEDLKKKIAELSEEKELEAENNNEAADERMQKIQEIKENAAVDLELRLQKKLRELPLENEQREQLKKDIEAAAVKTFNKMLFGLRDGVGKQTFRETLECLEQLYQTE